MAKRDARLGDWIEPHPHGIFVAPADAWVDPSTPQARALVTHGHADHARGHEAPVFLHGALQRLCDLYVSLGVDLGELVPVAGAAKADMAGHVVMCPPSALNDRWSRRLPDPITAMASGWMRVRQRARQKGVELPLILSDHADWDELTDTLTEIAPREVWVTHGREEALVHWCMTRQIKARALALVGFEDEDD